MYGAVLDTDTINPTSLAQARGDARGVCATVLVWVVAVSQSLRAYVALVANSHLLCRA